MTGKTPETIRNEDTLAVGERWKKAIEHHPLRVAASILLLGFGAGYSFNEWTHRNAPNSSPSAREMCRYHESYTCDGSLFVVAVRTDLLAGKAYVTIRQQTDQGAKQECTLSCALSERTRIMMAGCPIASSDPTLDCARADEVVLGWMPIPL